MLNILKAIMDFFSKMLGGYASYALIAVGLYAGIQTWRVKNLQAGRAKIEAQRDAFKAASESKDKALTTLALMQAREKKQNKDEKDAESAIRNTTDSTVCGFSEPFVAGLNWLRNNPDPYSDYNETDDAVRSRAKTSKP